MAQAITTRRENLGFIVAGYAILVAARSGG